MSLMGFASALDRSGVELQPGVMAGSPYNYGINQPLASSNSPSSTIPNSVYSQYYSTYTGPATAKHIEARQQYAIPIAPTAVYLDAQMQAVPYNQYYATYTGGNSLWIQGSTSWTQYAKVPQESSLSLLALSPTGGEGALYETYPDGKVTRSDYFFYPNSRIGFYADMPGRHVLYFVLAGQPSNQVTIDVVSTYNPPVYYAPLPTYYPYYWDFYPYYWDYYPYYWDYHYRDGDHHQGDGGHSQHDGDDHQGYGPGPSPPPSPPPADGDHYQGDADNHQDDGPGPSPPPSPPPSGGDDYQDLKPGLGPKDKDSKGFPPGNAWGVRKKA